MIPFFEGRSISVFEEPGEADEDLWVTFSVDSGGPWLGQSLLRSRSQQTVFIVSKTVDMYQTEEAGVAIAALAERTAAVRGRVVLLGSSMGGFGALLFSKALHTTHLIAAAPPVSIQPHIVGEFDPRFKDFDETAILRPSAQVTLSPTAQISILFDPLNAIDRKQFALISRRRNVVGYRFPMSGHGCLHTLDHAGVAEGLVLELVKDRAQIAEYLERELGRISKAIRNTTEFQFAAAERHFSAQEYGKALPFLWNVLDVNANFGPACDFTLTCLATIHNAGDDQTTGYLRLLTALLRDGLAEKAAGAAARALEQGGRSAPMVHMAAVIELRRERPDLASRLFAECLSLHPYIPEWFVEAAYTAYLNNNVDEARALITQAKSLGPTPTVVSDFERDYLSREG